MLPAPPFILIDDARPGGEARLYRDPVAIIAAARVDEVAPALQRVREATLRGLHAAGFLAYEAGAAFEPASGMLGTPTTPLLWFGLFAGHDRIEEVPALLPDPAGAWIRPLRPEIGFEDYREAFARVQALIRSGDIYQANLSFRAEVGYLGAPHAVYAALRARSRAGYGALVDTGKDVLASLSPELFFEVDEGEVTCRPMKGTARREGDAAADRFAAETLATDAKQRAENLMIVDLMRNDLSRIAAPGSVAVPRLFSVESYPTVHQLTSTITARLAAGHDAFDVLAALFPCGSITGAPKIRAMQVLRAVEQGSPRGPYTGAIGRFDPDGGARFNVAIRTLLMPAGADAAQVGLGGGIVADSTAEAEWDEAITKGAFLSLDRPDPHLIETMLFVPGAGIELVERHLARIGRSADALGYAFDAGVARAALADVIAPLESHCRIRLLLDRHGSPAIAISAPPEVPAELAVTIVPLPVPADDFRLRHKTTDRAFYDAARHAAGTDEVLFVRPDGLLTEGSFTSLFVPRDGQLLTPPTTLGLLPGVLRAELLASARAREAALTQADLDGGFLVGNALRGLMPARLVTPQARSAPPAAPRP